MSEKINKYTETKIFIGVFSFGSGSFFGHWSKSLVPDSKSVCELVLIVIFSPLKILGSTWFWQSTYTLEFLLTRAHVHSSILSLRMGSFGYLHAYLYIFLNARVYIQGPSWSDQFLLTYLEDSYQMAVVCALYEAPGDTVVIQTAKWDLDSSGNGDDEIFTLANVWMQVGRRTLKRKGAVESL